mgnify:CR=1 FL=1
MNYRNPALLRLANGAPCCAPGCGRRDGTVVAAHANHQEYGKGMAIKANDWAVAFLCAEHHRQYDEGKMMPEERYEFFHRAALRTYGYLLENGSLKVAP